MTVKNTGLKVNTDNTEHMSMSRNQNQKHGHDIRGCNIKFLD
jgi:hypothetical protein